MAEPTTFSTGYPHPMYNWGWIGDEIGRSASVKRHREAVYDADCHRSYTYNELNERANRLAHYLADHFDVKKGDRVAFLSRNRVEMVDGVFACGKLGAIFVPYNARLSVEELTQLLLKEKPKVLFYEGPFNNTVTQLKMHVPSLAHYVSLTVDCDSNGDLIYPELLASGNDAPIRCPNLDLEDPYLMIHTGGTTGLPKAALISQRAVLFNALNNIVDWGITERDSAHILLPMFHTGGWNILTLALLRVGGRVILSSAFDAKAALEILEEQKPTVVFGAATIFRMIYERPEFATSDWSSVRWVMSGAAPTPIQVMEKFWDKGIKFCSGHGLTEAGPMNLGTPVDSMTLEDIRTKHASVGKPFHFTTAKIVDEHGVEVPFGEQGEIIFAGPQIFSGYWENEEETQKTLRNGWVYTGDIGVEDEEGFYYIVGRKKNMFISGGENVFPPEIENVLYEIPEVYEVCVIGVPDALWGEVGKAIISLKPGANLNTQQVTSYLNAKLARYKIPKYIQFVEEIPKNSAGKIVVKEIARIYGGVQSS